MKSDNNILVINRMKLFLKINNDIKNYKKIINDKEDNYFLTFQIKSCFDEIVNNKKFIKLIIQNYYNDDNNNNINDKNIFNFGQNHFYNNKFYNINNEINIIKENIINKIKNIIKIIFNEIYDLNYLNNNKKYLLYKKPKNIKFKNEFFTKFYTIKNINESKVTDNKFKHNNSSVNIHKNYAILINKNKKLKLTDLLSAININNNYIKDKLYLNNINKKNFNSFLPKFNNKIIFNNNSININNNNNINLHSNNNENIYNYNYKYNFNSINKIKLKKSFSSKFLKKNNNNYINFEYPFFMNKHKSFNKLFLPKTNNNKIHTII